MTNRIAAISLISTLALMISPLAESKKGGNGGGGNPGGGGPGNNDLIVSFPALGAVDIAEDGNGTYSDGADGVAAHLNGIGNLIFNSGSRTVYFSLEDTAGSCAFGGTDICIGGIYFDGLRTTNASSHCKDFDNLPDSLEAECHMDQWVAGDSDLMQLTFTIGSADGATYKLRWGVDECDQSVGVPFWLDMGTSLQVDYNGEFWTFDTAGIPALLCREVTTTTGRGKNRTTTTTFEGTWVHADFDLIFTRQ